MIRLKVLTITVLMGVVLGGAGPLLIGRAEGATPIVPAELEKVPAYLRAEEAKKKVQKENKVMAVRNHIEKVRNHQSAKISQNLEEKFNGQRNERIARAIQLEEQKIRNKQLLAKSESEETTLNAKNELTDASDYVNKDDLIQLMQDSSWSEGQQEEASSDQQNLQQQKRRPANAWKIILASETRIVPAKNIFEVRGQKTNSHDSSADQLASGSAGHWQEGIDTEVTHQPLPSENRDTLIWQAYRSHTSSGNYAAQSDDDQFQKLGRRLSRAREL